MATKKKLAQRTKPEKSVKTRSEDTATDLTLTKRSVHILMSATIDSLVDEADAIRGVAQSLQDLGATHTNGDSSELRSAAGVVRTHALGMLMSAATILMKSERIATIADVKAYGGAT